MEFQQFLFYWFSFWLITASLTMILTRNTVRSVMSLVLVFFSAASIWMLLEAEFLAVILVLVYVGALMVMFLFVVMMLDIDKSTLKAKFAGYLPFGVLVSVVLISEISLVLGEEIFGLNIISEPIRHSIGYSNITELAKQLYTEFVYPFELASVILLVAIIAAITLTQRHNSTRRKIQDIKKQVSVEAKNRLRMVSDKKGSNND
ncbi:NADH-ubiquinone oxidoreductase chain J [hydrothermal vent metagenome]|uniref:NADH-ubiquinone oxidoreductase chain J n=1 Tax=hydrothermal vent metagenome TaxID=652676 RepID=A0A1W1CBY4_9ZZZZ